MMDSDIDNSQLSSPSRRDAIKTVGLFGGALSLRADTLAHALRSGETIRLGLIADLHGGLATDAEQRLDAFLKAMKDIYSHELMDTKMSAWSVSKRSSKATISQCMNECLTLKLCNT